MHLSVHRTIAPILLLQPDEVTTMLVKDVKPLSTEVLEANENEIERNQYHRDFSAFHKELTNNRFAKIVLARCVQETNSPRFKS